MSSVSSDSPEKNRFSVLKLFSQLVFMVGGSVMALGGGIVAAHWYPATSQKMPLIETAFQYSREGWKVGQQQMGAWMKQAGIASLEQVQPSTGVFPADGLRITLPSDVLFKDSQSALRSKAQSLLSPVVAELRTYPGATIRIATHTDDLGEASDNRDLSFRQAQSLRLYLEENLGTGYRWVVVGYGASAPLVENRTDANRQRNRRTEIAIGPR
ncbi:MAG: OmpA family protein [Leptolyngbyaceae cyanobacterium bins.59]|nr:OmpA family protein [Leptolyngbyaceae cyanobacterium bins.59]